VIDDDGKWKNQPQFTRIKQKEGVSAGLGLGTLGAVKKKSAGKPVLIDFLRLTLSSFGLGNRQSSASECWGREEEKSVEKGRKRWRSGDFDGLGTWGFIFKFLNVSDGLRLL
jgi:hypothetical protein